MPNTPDQDKIERLKKALYSQKGVSRNAHILDLNTHENEDVSSKWQSPVAEQINARDVGKKTSLTKKILIFALMFFAVSISVAGYILFKGGNVISNAKIDVLVVSPASVRAGDVASFDVRITNKNKSTLELVDLLTEYPKGTRSPMDKNTDLPRERIPVGTIKPGETVTKTLSIVPFGGEGDKLSMDLSLEYRLPQSESVFNKDLSYEFAIGSSPITLTIDGLNEINANQEINFTANIVSNSSETLKNILLILNIPFGFEMIEANPKPIAGKYVWALGDIEAEGKRTITIKGKIAGEANQNRVFKFNLGTENSKDKGTLASTIALVEHSVMIKKPFLGSDILVERRTGDNFVARSGSKVNFSVEYENNISLLLNDIEMSAKINGEIVDKRSIASENAFYDSAQSLLKWSKFEEPTLSSLAPGKSGAFLARFETLKADDPKVVGMKNPYITIDLNVKGKRLSESGVPEEITSTVSKTIKIQTDANLSGQVLHFVGPIENEGDVPPKVGKKTEYTLVWRVSNNFNDINNATVSAILPSYVTWTGITSPTSEKISYNPDSRQITWNLGKISAPTKEKDKFVAFQVAITPSLGQVGQVPVLIGPATLQGVDAFTNTGILDSIKEGSTQLVGDPQYEFGQERVEE